MSLTEEKKQALIARIEAGDMRADAKKEALAILSQPEVSEEDRERLEQIIQADIDADFAEIPGLEEAVAQDDEYLALVAKHEEELKKIEAEVQATAASAEEQIAQAEEMEKQLTALEDELNLGDVKSRLGME